MVTIENSEQLNALTDYPFFSGKSFEDQTSVFICKNFSCSLPLHTLYEVNSEIYIFFKSTFIVFPTCGLPIPSYLYFGIAIVICVC